MRNTLLKRGARLRLAPIAAILSVFFCASVQAEPFTVFDTVSLSLSNDETFHEEDIENAALSNIITATDMSISAESSWTGTRGVSLDGIWPYMAEALKIAFIDDQANFDSLSLVRSLSVNLASVIGRTVTGLFIDPEAIQTNLWAGEGEYDFAIDHTAVSVTAAESLRAGDDGSAAARIKITNGGSLTAVGRMAFQNGRMSASGSSRIELSTQSGPLGDTGSFVLLDSTLVIDSADGINSIGNVSVTATGTGSAAASITAQGAIGFVGDMMLENSSLHLSTEKGIDSIGNVSMTATGTGSATALITAQGAIGSVGDMTLAGSGLQMSAGKGIGSIQNLTLTQGSSVTIESAAGAVGSIRAIRADASEARLRAWDGFQSIGEVTVKNGARAAIASNLSLGSIGSITIDSASLHLSNAQQKMGSVQTVRLLKSGSSDPELILASEDGSASAQIKAANLDLQAGTVRLSAPAAQSGLLQSGGTLRYGSWLLLGRLTGSGRITATGNSVISLGADTSMLTAGRIVRALGDAATYADGGSLDKATLITTPSGIGSVGAVKILLGDAAQNAGSSVTVGARARVIVDWTLQSSLAQGEASDTVYAANGSEVILSGWTGETETLSWLTGGTDVSLTIVNSDYHGRAALGAGGLTLTRQSWGEVPGLHARIAMSEVETRGVSASTEPGWAFIADAVSSGDHVGVRSLANVIDSAAFLTAASGVTLAAEMALDETYRSLLMRRHAVPDGEKHWHALAWSSSSTVPKVFDGGSGRWGATVKAGGGSLGADISLNADWTASLAVSGATTDTKSTGNVSRIKGEATSAVVTAMVTRRFSSSEFTLAASAGRSQLEATQRVNKHILHAEPEIESGALSAIWQGGYSLGRFSVEPYVTAGVRSARLKKGEINDNRIETGVAGTGFETSTGRRLWGEVEAGAGLSAGFSLFGADITPRALFGVRAAAGDRAWKVKSCLRGAAACDEAVFAGVPRISGLAALGVNIARRDRVPVMTGGFLGFGARQDGDKTEPRAWMLDLAVSYERGSDRQKSKGLSLLFRQLF